MKYTALTLLALLVATGTAAKQAAPPQTPLLRLQASIERITRSVNATWGIYIRSLDTSEEVAINADRQMDTMSTIKIPLMVEAFEQIKTGDFLPYIANDVGVLEADGRAIVISIFTANHFGSGDEEAIGRIAEQVAAYFGYPP